MTATDDPCPPGRARGAPGWWLALLTLLVLMPSGVGLGAPLWPDEQAMINDSRPSVRTTFVIDPGVGNTIPPEVFVTDGYAQTFLTEGFDWNFLTWAPTGSYTPTSEDDWSACDRDGFFHISPVPGGPTICAQDHLRRPELPAPHGTVRHDLAQGPITVRRWGDDWISVVCGNWGGVTGLRSRPGPMPTISGVKYEDRNADGRRQAGEPGLAGWTIRLRYGGAEVATTTTGAGGRYRFRLNAGDSEHPMRAGTYRVEEVQRPGWTQSDAPGAISVPYGAGATDFSGNDFGNWRPATVRGTKFEDMDADGPTATDPRVADFRITATGPMSGAATTGVDGGYAITGLKPGGYVVRETDRNGWVRSYPATGEHRFTLTSGQVVQGIDFGNYRPGTITGRKFNDTDVDGDGSGEPGLAGWTFCLAPGPCATTIADGTYRFPGLKPGGYTVTEQAQTHWRATTPTSGRTDLRVRSGQTVTADFGNICLGSVDVEVPDGVRLRLEEVDVPGVLSNDPALPRTGTGSQLLEDLLPGTYRLTMVLPDGVTTTDPDLTAVDGSLAVVKTITVAACERTSVGLPALPAADGFITGGGIGVPVADGSATAGFEFRGARGGPRGTLEYNGHPSGPVLHTDDIEAVGVAGADGYVFGFVTVDGRRVRFALHVVDAGEPGTDDRFELLLADGYRVGFDTTIAVGNIQVHPQRRSGGAS